MSDSQITIAIDAMGGEKSPYKIIYGTELFLKNYSDVKVVFFGDESKIIKEIRSRLKFLTDVGRVLNVVGKAKNIKSALNITYKVCSKIHWKGYFYRKDIGL